jgi:diguanylate cyclase (GGDEF)-like protein/PAS domain S-box-containing protein
MLIKHAGSSREQKEAALQVDKIAHQIESVRDRLASLHQNLTKLRTANEQLQSKIAEPKRTQEELKTLLSLWHGALETSKATNRSLLKAIPDWMIRMTSEQEARIVVSGEDKILMIDRDISDRKQAEKAMIEKEELLQLVLDNIPQYIFWKDRNSVYLGCNRNFAIIAGLNHPLEIVGKTDYDLPWKKEESDFFRECDARVMETDTAEYHIIEPLLQADGTQVWLNTNKIPLHDAEGNVVGILGTFEDITERQIVQEKIRYQAMHDLLTGLPNRTLFNEQLSVSLTQACNSQSMLAVMFLDLDRFNTINDTLGHAVGDRLLQEVAKRLSSCLRQNDILARWGGDEFTLLVSQTSSAEEVAKIAQRLLNALKPAFNLEGHSQACRSTSLHISSSIGITLYPQDGEDAETLLRNADAALHRAKQQGRNNFQFYTAAMNSQACELLVLENELHHALKRREFVVYYQPQVNTTTGEITGMEALVRWQHPKFGLVAPDKFIPLAEETGLIVPIGEWVLKTACAQNKAWQDAGLPPLRVAVNLSVRQFQQPLLLNIVSQTLQETGLSPQFLDLEITETIAMQNVELTKAILSELHQMGVYLSIDDFGTGYCSLGYLKQFPLHTLKIDKSFVRDLATEPQNAGIINAIMMLGRGFNLRVIAEGVETEAEKDCLRSFQCEEMQGYLSSPPLPAEEATKLLQNSYSMSGKSSFSV